MLISDNAGYKIFCDVRKTPIKPNDNYVRIYTKYDFAREPNAEQTKIELFLNDAELEALRKALIE
jgi:hypothetical protein